MLTFSAWLNENKSDNDFRFYEEWLNEAKSRITHPEPTEAEIIRAIKNRKYVGIYYEGENVESGFRLIEPLVYGIGYKYDGKKINDDRYIRAFVIKATDKDKNFQKSKINRRSVSKSKRTPYWRMLRVDKIKDWFEFPKKFSILRDGYNTNDKHINNIIAFVPTEELKIEKLSKNNNIGRIKRLRG